MVSTSSSGESWRAEGSCLVALAKEQGCEMCTPRASPHRTVLRNRTGYRTASPGAPKRGPRNLDSPIMTPSTQDSTDDESYMMAPVLPWADAPMPWDTPATPVQSASQLTCSPFLMATPPWAPLRHGHADEDGSPLRIQDEADDELRKWADDESFILAPPLFGANVPLPWNQPDTCVALMADPPAMPM